MTEDWTQGVVHVMCASPGARNPGMTTVDRAFRAVAEGLGLGRVEYWRLWDQSEWREPVGGSSLQSDGAFLDESTGLMYRNARGRLDEFLDADAVVFWGDFMHMAFYVQANIDTLARTMDGFTDATARDIAETTLLLRDQPDEVLARTLTYGTTLSFNTPADYRGDYGAQLESFVSRAGGAWFRDTYSAWVAQVMGGNAGATTKGTDAAFLLPAEPRRPRTGRLGVFYGRSAMQPEPLAAFGRGLTAALGLEPVWIPWGHEPAFWPMDTRRRFRLAWPGLEHESRAPGFAQRVRALRDAAIKAPPPRTGRVDFDELLAEVRGCDVVVTDTYHLAVNAWRMGIPAVCVVDRPRTWSVNSGAVGARRDKREELYSQLEASALIVTADELHQGVRGAVARIAEVLSGGDLVVAHTRVADMVALGTDAIGGGLQRVLAQRSGPAAALP